MAVKQMALDIDGELAFCQAYYVVIIESREKQGEVSHFQDMETKTQRVYMVFLKHTVIPKR